MPRRNILIVDDNPDNIQLVASELKEEGYGIAFARSGADALEQAEHRRFDLLLLDIMMPGMNGIDVCRELKRRPEYKDVPVIFLTARDEKETVLEGFEAGGADYVTKPFYGPEVRSRVQAQLRAREAQELLEQAVDDLSRQLLSSVQHQNELETEHDNLIRFNRELMERANTDQLTGLANRYHLTAIAEYEQERSERSHSPYSLILGDIDRFKKLNDTYGHECGDAVLQEVARRLSNTVRAQDRVARWGGEEFLIFLPDTETAGARVLARRLGESIFRAPVAYGDRKLTVTMTFGVSSCVSGDLDACVERADIALYEGKQRGRNRTAVYREEVSEDGS
ncbi:MAG: diguanylate cyclase [Spirochaetaceae bacterium]